MKQINIGIENFKELIDNNYYYIDKTDLILDVLSNPIISYTRPRRFGKTLNMSMLYYFFSNKEKENAYLFDGLKITQNHEIMKHQNQYPIIYITLKEMKGEMFQQQKNQFAILIFNVIEKNLELLTSNQLSDVRKQILSDLHSMKTSDEILSNSLQILCESLSLHYHQKVILLIDEYDVPLQNAYINGYYKEMTHFINHVFSSALKTNDSLKRGILTGCLRIAKESIFTGLNNFAVRSIIDKEANDCFGFRQNEIDELLSYYI